MNGGTLGSTGAAAKNQEPPIRTLFLSILVPVVVILAWGLLFVALDRISSAESRAETKRAARAARRERQPGETDDHESGRA